MRENTTASKILELATQGYTVTRQEPQRKQRLDNWINETSGFGTQHATNNTTFDALGLIGAGQLNSLYRSDWVVRKGVDAPAEDQTRKGIKFLHNDDDEGNTDDTNVKKVEKLEELLTDTYDMQSRAKEAISFSRLSGGSACVFNYGGTAEEQRDPIEDSQKREIKWIKVFPSWDCIPISWYTDFDHPKFLQPEHYQILIKGPSIGMTVVTHESRLVLMQGRLTTPLNIANNRGWFDSYVQAVYTAIRDFQVASSSASGTMEDFSYTTLGVRGLSQAVMNRDDETIQERYYLARQKLHSGNLGLYDAESEKMEKHGTPVTGLSDLWDRFGDIICGGFDMPRSIFFSAETGDLGGDSSETDRSNYFDKQSSAQETTLRPWQNEFIHNVSMVENIDDNDVKYIFNPMREKSSSETIKERKEQADTDAIYIDRGVVSSEEITLSRFSKAEPDLDTVLIDFEEREKMKEIDDIEEEESNNLIQEIHANTKPDEKEDGGKLIQEKDIVKKEEKTDSQPQIIEVKPQIKVEAPQIKVEIPEQKDHTESISKLDKKLDKLESKLDEDKEIIIDD